MSLHNNLPPLSDPRELIDAALAGEPIDMPVNYEDLADTNKSNIVATRLARNIGPLFGVPNPEGPFGQMSWLSHLPGLTLQEIARGAPQPTREVIIEHGLNHKKSDGGFQIIGRYVHGKTPNEIVGATLNTYEPDPKTATVLTGVNQLLKRQTETVTEAIRSDTFGELSSEQKLQAYGAIVFGVYRPQPLLVYTGWKARTLQRALRSDFRPLIPKHLQNISFARCETASVPAPKPGPKQPYDLELIDQTANLLAPLLQTRRPEGVTAKTIIDSFGRTILDSSGLRWQEYYNPETEERTVRAIDDPAAISQLFAVTVRNLL